QVSFCFLDKSIHAVLNYGTECIKANMFRVSRRFALPNTLAFAFSAASLRAPNNLSGFWKICRMCLSSRFLDGLLRSPLGIVSEWVCQRWIRLFLVLRFWKVALFL